MKIYIMNSQSTNYSHEIFNSGFCEILLNVYPSLSIKYYGEKDNINLIKNMISADSKERINFEEIVVKQMKKDSKLFKSFFNLFYFYIKSFLKDISLYLRVEKEDVIYYTQSNPFSLFFLNFINLFLQKEVYVVLHGEVQIFIEAKFYRPISLLYKIVFKYFLFSKKIKLIVLGESIKINLSKYLKNKKNRVLSLNHPFYPKEKIFSKDKNYIEVSVIGNNFFQDFLNIVKETTNSKIRFKVISKTKGVKLKNLIYPFEGKQDFLTREEINKEIQESDYILFLYPENSYKYMASGAIFDAISNRKPIIFLKNDYFNYISSTVGEIGYSFYNKKLIVEFLNNFRGEVEKNRVFKQNIERYIKENTLIEIASKFKKELRK